MKLIQLNITEFGCLKDRAIALSDGMNIIGGDNESGKSTVMLFIKFMLYGLPRKSSKSFERERSISFAGHRAAGSMILESKGKQYKIERQAVAAGKLTETLRVTDLATGEELVGSAEPGERFLGVPCEVFENSCGISQMRVADINKSQAASAIENMLASADESIDVKKILDRIDSVRKEYKLNKGDGGALYRKQTEISELRSQLDSATKKHLAADEMSARLEKKEQDAAHARAELERAEIMLAGARNAEILKRFEKIETDKTRLDQKKQALSELIKENSAEGFVPDDAHVSALRAGLEQLCSAEKKQAARQEEYERASKLADKRDPLAFVGERIEESGGKDKILARAADYHKKSRINKIFGIIMLISGMICAAAGVIVPMLAARVGLIAFGALLFVLGICLLSSSAKAQKAKAAICDEYGKAYEELDAHLSACLERLKESRMTGSEAIIAEGKLSAAAEEAGAARARLVALLELTGKHTDSDIKQTAKREIERLTEFNLAHKGIEREIYALEAVINSDSASLAGYDRAELLKKTDASAPSLDDASRRVKFNKAKKESLEREISHLRESLAALRAGIRQSPIELSDRILALEDRLRRDTEYFEALMLAKQSIEQASLTLSGNVTPDISRRAGEMLALISGGKHASVQTTKNLDLSVEQDGFGVASELLSGGTRDAAYLCLRISLMLRLFGDDLPPLIMDEALCQLDDRRAMTVLSLLHKLSDIGLQCVILTCHSREERLCEENGYTCNRIVLA